MIVGIRASVAISMMRDYTRRAKVSEVVLSTASCKNAVSEQYVFLESAPDPGKWGCETGTAASQYAGPVQTSSDGVIRVAIRGLDGLMNDRHIYLVPVKSDGTTPMVAPADLGRNVRRWMCGSDWQPVRNALPADCRADTTGFSSQTFN
jgi:Tfp pilus assembly major pilin PilA